MTVHREVAMTILRRITMAVLTVALLTTGGVRAASTTNFSDQWWIEAESGWGASVLQQADILFIDLFVYGADNKPTWFTAAAAYQTNSPSGHVVFTGDLYQTNGPYYGGSFNSSAVTYAKVGTLTFDADTTNTAKLTYTVGGTPVVKNVTRQTWRYENLTGNYYGGWVNDQVSCTPASDNGHYESFGTIQITHNTDNSLTMHLVAPATEDDLLLAGTYSQSGHMGQIAATMKDLTVEGSVTFFEIERTISGFTGRFVGNIKVGADSCVITNGRIGGVRR
jgi:hypothetical protein